MGWLCLPAALSRPHHVCHAVFHISRVPTPSEDEEVVAVHEGGGAGPWWAWGVDVRGLPWRTAACPLTSDQYNPVLQRGWLKCAARGRRQDCNVEVGHTPSGRLATAVPLPPRGSL